MDEFFGETSRGGTQLRRRWAVDGAKAAVLIVHGIGEHSGRYVHVGDFLESHGYDVLAYDQVGFGQTEGIRAYVDSYDDYLDDVEALMVERRSEGVPVVLLGHSLGGLTVATYLQSDRSQPDLGILSAPALGASVPAWQRIAAPIMGRVLPKLFIPSEIKGEILTHDIEIATAYENDPLGVQGQTAGLGRAVFATMAQTAANIAKIKLPTYVLHGSADELVPQEYSLPLAELPNVTYRTWDGLRHECFNEHEKLDVLAELVAWLDTQLSN